MWQCLSLFPNSIGSFACVVNHSDNTVSVINTSWNTVLSTVPVGEGPRGLVMDPANRCAYVTNNSSSTLSVISPPFYSTVVATVPAGGSPCLVATNPAGNFVYVVSAWGSVSVLDTTSKNIVATVPVNQPGNLAVNPAGTFAYVAIESNNNVDKIALAPPLLTCRGTLSFTSTNCVAPVHYFYRSPPAPVVWLLTPETAYL